MKKIYLIIIFILNIGLINSLNVNIVTPSTTVSGNLTNFTELLDTPNSYSGEGGNCVKVNVGETGLEFDTCSGSVETDPIFTNANSTLARTGNCPAGQVVQNTTNSGVQCVTASSSGFSTDQDNNNLNRSANVSFGGIRVSGQVWINDTRGKTANVNNLILHLEEMSTDTLLDKSRSTLSCVDGELNYTLYAIDGVGDWNFNGTIYAGPGVSVASATITLTCGTDITPVTNYIYWELVGGVPTMKTSSTYPTVTHIDTATFIVGACSGSSYTIYSYSRNRYEVDTFIKRVIERFEESGTLYVSGFVPSVNLTTINITSGGEFFNGIFEMTSTNFIDGSSFYWINGSGNFIQATSLSSLNQYQGGTSFSGNQRMNVVWGLVPVNTTGGVGPTQMRLVAIPQSDPGASRQYISAITAEQDQYDVTNYFPSNIEVKNVFVPIARTIIRASTSQFELFASGNYYKDLRGKITSGGGSATSTDTSGLVPYTGATSNLNMTNYNITANYFFGNGSQLTSLPAGGNASWNQSGANALYISSGNLTIYNGLINNASYLSTYNATYNNATNRLNNLTGKFCSGTNKMNGVNNNGSINCIADATGGVGGGNPFNQVLNQTSDVSFNNTYIGTYLDIGSNLTTFTSIPVINMAPQSLITIYAGIPIILNAGFNILSASPLFTFKLFYANTEVRRNTTGGGDSWYLISVFDSYFRSSSNTTGVQPYAPNGLVVRNQVSSSKVNVGTLTKDTAGVTILDTFSSFTGGTMAVSNYYGNNFQLTLSSDPLANLTMHNIYGQSIKSINLNSGGNTTVGNYYGIKIQELNHSRITNSSAIMIDGSGTGNGINFGGFKNAIIYGTVGQKNNLTVQANLTFFTGGISVASIEDRTEVWDSVKDGSALDKVYTADELVDDKGEIDHLKMAGGYCTNKTDLSRPVLVTGIVEECIKVVNQTFLNTASSLGYDIKQIEGLEAYYFTSCKKVEGLVTTYPFNYTYCAYSLTEQVAKHEEALALLYKEEIAGLKTQNTLQQELINSLTTQLSDQQDQIKALTERLNKLEGI